MIIEEWPFVGSGLEAEAADHERKLANRKRRLEDYQADLEVPFEPDEYHEHSEALRELWRALQPTATYLRLEKRTAAKARARAAKEAERPFRVATGEQSRHRVSIRKRLAREALEKEYLHYDGQDVLKKRGKALQLEKLAAEAEQGSGPGGTFAMDPGSDAHDGGDSELPPLPNFVVTFLEQRHGVRALVRQKSLS